MTIVATSDGHQLELVDLLDPTKNDPNGEFAKAEFVRDNDGRLVFRGGRTIGVPARVACQIVSSTHTRFIVAHTIREIRATWNKDLPAGTTWVKPFDPSYTEMLPAFHWVTIKPWKMRDRTYEWFLSGPPYTTYPENELLQASVDVVGTTYIRAVQAVIHDQLERIPDGEPIGVAFSGGADSAAVAIVLLDLIRKEGRKNVLHWLTLAIDNRGTDLEHAEEIAALFRETSREEFLQFYHIAIRSRDIDRDDLMRRSAELLEEYHVRDVECGMAGILLSEGVEQKVKSGEIPKFHYDFNGDGGNEIFGIMLNS